MKLAELNLLTTWKALGGGPLKGRRSTAFWRNGNGRNVALSVEKNVFFDHVSGAGGGPLALVMLAHACDREHALRWLEQHCGLDPKDPLGAEELRERANRHARAEEVAERVMHWHAGLLRNLEQSKVTIYQEFLVHPGEQTERSWEDACRRLYQAQQLSGAALIDAYRNGMEQDPDAVERLVKAAREDVAHAELYAGLMVALLGVSALRERRHE